MSKSLDQLYKNQSHIYKYFLYGISLFCIVFFFPKGGQFKYELQKGKPWQYENLYAPFDFSISKEKAEILAEEEAIKNNHINFYQYDSHKANTVYDKYDASFSTVFSEDDYNPNQLIRLRKTGISILDELYANGIVNKIGSQNSKKKVYIIKQNEANLKAVNELYGVQDVETVVTNILEQQGLVTFKAAFQELFFNLTTPNVFYDENLSVKALNEELSNISYTRGTIDEGKLIIARGEVVEAENYKILKSLKGEYESELLTAKSQYFILFGYAILAALVLMMLLLFLKKYRPEIYENNTKVTFIFFNVLLMVFITTVVIKYDEAYVFVVPLCILPLILKTFFDARLGLFVHVLTV
jgi:membrane-associated HD superfamily phosphohydrolase